MIEPKQHDRKIEVGDTVVSPTGVEGEVVDLKRDAGPGDSDLLTIEFENGKKQERSERTIELK